MQFQGPEGTLFSARLIDTLQTKVLKGYKQIRIEHETTSVDSLDGTQSQIKALGRKHGADIVVWGSVLCTNKSACIRPRVTVVAEDAKGLAGMMREEPEKEVGRDELGKSALEMDKRVLGLASRIAGLALYEEDNYADAAWHLEKAREGSEIDAEAVRQPLMVCYERLGSWKEAEEIANEVMTVGKQKKDEAMQALGHAWLGRMQRQRGELDGALRELREAEKKYRALGAEHEISVAATMGAIADILAARGQLDEALRIRREEQLPVYQKLGARRDILICEWWIATYLQKRNRTGDLAEARRLAQKAYQAAIEMKLPEAQSLDQFLRRLPENPATPSTKPSAPAP